MIVLTTARLYLRDFEPSDALGLADHFSVLGIDATTVAGLVASVRAGARGSARADFQLAVLESESGTPVGTCGLHLAQVEPPEGWVSYSIVPARRRRGYGAEAAAAVVDFAFERCGVDRLRATCAPENAGSLRILDGLGFWREGRMSEPSPESPLGRQMWLFGLRRRDWIRRRESRRP